MWTSEEQALFHKHGLTEWPLWTSKLGVVIDNPQTFVKLKLSESVCECQTKIKSVTF